MRASLFALFACALATFAAAVTVSPTEFIRMIQIRPFISPSGSAREACALFSSVVPFAGLCVDQSIVFWPETLPIAYNKLGDVKILAHHEPQTACTGEIVNAETFPVRPGNLVTRSTFSLSYTLITPSEGDWWAYFVLKLRGRL